MDNRKTFQDLEARYEELLVSYGEVKEDWMAEFEGTADYHAYMSYTQDEVKKEMYPEWFEKEQKMNALKTKVDAFEKELILSAKNLYKELSEQVTKLEEKIAVNEEHIKSLEEKIAAINLELNNLKATEEYKNGDQATLLKVEELEEELKLKTDRKEKMISSIKDIKQEIGKVKAEKEELVDNYGKEVENIGDNSNPEQEEQEQEQEENKPVKNGGMPVFNTPPAELSPEEKAKKEQEEKDKKIREDYEGLKGKIKKGELSEEDFASLVAIMKDKENYAKLGITTGIVFNKSRGIFKTLNKYAEGNPEKQALVSEAYKTYEGIFHEKHSDKKLGFLSKFLVLDEVEAKTKVPELEAGRNPVPKSISFTDDLGEQVALPGLENEIPPRTKSVDSKEQSI